MPVARATAISLAFSGLFALAVIWAPVVGVRHHPRVSLLVSLLGAVLGGTVILVEAAAPLIQRQTFDWPGTAALYFLAMAHMFEDAPYPFFWTPHWVFWIGRLTPLIPVGGILAVAASYPARRVAGRITLVMMLFGYSAVFAYAAAGVYAAQATWHGILL